MTRRPVGAFALLTAIVACAGGGDAARSPTPTDAPSNTVRAFVGDGAPLEPGRYRYDAFEPAMTVEVGPGWVGGHTHAEFFDVQREAGVLVGFASPRFVFDRDGPIDVGGVDARQALERISSIDGLEAEPITSTTVDGRTAFEMRTRSEVRVELFRGDEGTFMAEPGAHRLIALEVDGVLVLVFAQIWAEDAAPHEAPVQDVIDSVDFG